MADFPNPASILQRIEDEIKSRRCRTEEDIKMVIAPILDEIAGDLSLEKAEYERKIQRSIFRGKRTDALYGRFIIDYKSPNLMSKKSEAIKAVKQVEEYIQGKSESEGIDKKMYFACVIDGYNILFVRYNTRISTWSIRNVLPFTESDILRILEAMRGLKRKALDADEIIQDLGPRSPVAKDFISNLFNRPLVTERSKVLFDEWFKTFQQVVAYDEELLKELSKYYDIRTERGQEKKLLFAVQTYFATVMKLVSAEVAQLYSGGKWASSYLGELSNSPESGLLRDKVKELEEEGGFFQKITRIKNYLEGDFFSWYVDEWDDHISASFKKVVEVLQNYEPGTSNLEPERIKDLFKLLYENLVPKKLRHSFGEYYTPDWLADLLIERVGLEKEKKIIDMKVLDPSCGSGTFLISVIRLMKIYGEEHNLEVKELFQRIITNVVGFDLNPIAVLASRSNYIVALGDLIRGHEGDFEIPVYLADSLTQRFTSFDGGGGHMVDTTVGKFLISEELIQSGQINQVFEFIKRLIRTRNPEINLREFLKDAILDQETFEKNFKQNFSYPFSDATIESVREIYVKIQKLEGEGRNKIWVNILKNISAPLLKGKFDYVIGNPPWINWESLPEGYRNSSEDLWRRYGLLATGVKRGGTGTKKRDLSMLFITFSIKNYTRDNGILGMLCPYTLFKVTAGTGFRREILKYEIRNALDLVEMDPFESATTRTSMIVLRNVSTQPSLPSLELWRPDGTFSARSPLEEVKKNSITYRLNFFPSNPAHLDEPWFAVGSKAFSGLRKAIGCSAYTGHEGVNTGLNGPYWVDIIKEEKKEVYIKNLGEIGRIKVPVREGWIEKELIYPLARGRNIDNLKVNVSSHIILPVDEKGDLLNEEKMRTRYPLAYAYFENFKTKLLARKGVPYKQWYSNRKKLAMPFYALFNVRNNLSPLKVAWEHVSGEISGKAKLNVGLLNSSGGPVIFDKSLFFIALNNEKEANYVLGVLNSSIAKLIVASYSIESHISADILTIIDMQLFDRADETHCSISNETQKLSRIIAELSESEIIKNQRKIDELVASLYDISNDELDEIEADLKLLLNQNKTEVGEELEDEPE